MKLHTRSLLAVFLLSIVLFVHRPATAEELSIAVVDVKMLMSESKASQSLQKKLQSQRQAFVDKLAGEEKSLRKIEQDLIDERANLSPEDFAKKKNAFEEKLLKSRAEAQKKKQELDKANAKALNELQEQIVKAVRLVADEKGYDLVFSTQNIVIADKTIDVTEEALKQLNKAVSDIALDVPSK